MRSRLTLNHLEAVIAVAELLSFQKAALRLHMSQPALSRCIQGAEDAVGAKLFDRDTRNVSLTPAGVSFFPIARRLLLDFESSLQEVAQYLDGNRGTLSIAALPSVGASFLPDVLCEFVRLWPEVNVSVDAPHSQIITQLVANSQVDFGITMRPPKSEKVQYEHLFDDEFVLICGPNHPLANASSCKWKVFEKYPYIALSPTTSMSLLTQQIFKQLHLDIQPAYQMAGIPLTGKLVAAGLGITALPRLVLPQLGIVDIRVIPLRSPSLIRPLGILTREGRTPSVLANNFLQLLKSAMQSDRQQEDRRRVISKPVI